MADSMSATRAMWTMFEPIHDVTYFAPEALAGFAEAGLRGFWRGYFAGRAAPLACAGPSAGEGPSAGPAAAVVSASFFNFAPSFVERAIPGVWDLITPADAITVREAGATAALTRLLAGHEAEAARAAAALWRAVEELDFAGRPLAAANAARPVSADPLTSLWQATTVLREHRGDGHFAALAAADVDGCEAVVLRCAKDLARDVMQPVRGWTDEQWTAAAARLAERGWIDENMTMTEPGRAAHDAVEAQTDQAASRPWRRMTPADLHEVANALYPLAAACAAALPGVTPVGVGSPTRPAV